VLLPVSIGGALAQLIGLLKVNGDPAALGTRQRRHLNPKRFAPKLLLNHSVLLGQELFIVALQANHNYLSGGLSP
jgi:hypothetical protein